MVQKIACSKFLGVQKKILSNQIFIIKLFQSKNFEFKIIFVPKKLLVLNKLKPNHPKDKLFHFKLKITIVWNPILKFIFCKLPNSKCRKRFCTTIWNYCQLWVHHCREDSLSNSIAFQKKDTLQIFRNCQHFNILSFYQVFKLWKLKL